MGAVPVSSNWLTAARCSAVTAAQEMPPSCSRIPSCTRRERAQMPLIVWSSSRMVSVRGAGGCTPLPPDTCALTVTDLASCSSSTVLGSASIHTRPALLRAPGAMVSAAFALSAKSLACAGACAAAATVTTVAALDGRSSAAVTVLTPPSSTVSGASASVSTGVGSSSTMVSVRAAASTRPVCAAAVTDTVVSGASRSSSSATMCTVLVLSATPAANTSVLPRNWKPAANGDSGADARMVTVVDAAGGGA